MLSSPSCFLFASEQQRPRKAAPSTTAVYHSVEGKGRHVKTVLWSDSFFVCLLLFCFFYGTLWAFSIQHWDSPSPLLTKGLHQGSRLHHCPRGSAKPRWVHQLSSAAAERKRGHLSKWDPLHRGRAGLGEPHPWHKHTVANHLSSSVYSVHNTWPWGSTNVYWTSVPYQTIAEAKGTETKHSFYSFMIPKALSHPRQPCRIKLHLQYIYHTPGGLEPERPSYWLKTTQSRNRAFGTKIPGSDYLTVHFYHITLFFYTAIWH